jgi:uncharacterized membrane protein YphA (DoxX/SURF4 family)
MNKKTSVEIVSILYMCLFLYAAGSKWMDYNLSREQIALMPLLASVAHILAWLVPLVEIVLAVLIYIPKFRRTGLYAATGLMILFTGYVAYMMLFYTHLPCSCGGLIDKLSWKGHLIFNSVFVILGVLSLVLLNRHLSNGQTSNKYSIAQ